MDPLAAFDALGTSRGRENPYQFYGAIRAHGDLVPLKKRSLVAVGYDVCAEALRTPDLRVLDGSVFDLIHPDWRTHSSVRAFTDSMLYSNPPGHARQRRAVKHDFASQRIHRMRPVIETMTTKLLDRMAALDARGSSVDIMEDFASRLPIAVVSAMLGLAEDRLEWFRDIAAAIAVSTDGFADPHALATADSAMDELAEHLDEMIASRRRRPEPDLLSRLVEAHDTDPGELGRDELIGNLMLLLTAGFETTAFVLGHGVLLALRHPRYAARLLAEPSFADAYVEEVLRYEPPVHITSRFAARDVSVAGHHITSGTRVVLALAAANRDQRRYANPDRFDPDRPHGQALTFGAGSHYCLGAGLARLEARVALPMLLRRFPRLTLSGTVTYRDRSVIRGLVNLPVCTGRAE